MVIDYFASEVVLAKINAKEDTVITKTYNVSAYPTLVLTDKDGEEIDRIVGYLDAPDFVQKINDYRNGIGTLADLLSRADTLEDRVLYFDIAEKYKYRGGAEEAKEWFDKVIAAGEPTDSLSGESRGSLADLIRRTGDYDAAREAYSEIMKDFAGTNFAENAEIWRAYLYQKEADTTNALKFYKEFMQHYPESEENEWIQKQIDKLEGKESETK
jgi:tetratricopeptide (TPR) repeat protein